MNSNLFTRRSFVKALGAKALGAKALGAWGLVTLPYLSLGEAATQVPPRILPSYGPNARKRLSFLANRETDIEGAWAYSQIEGEIPFDLNGMLIRNGPGSKSVAGRALGHFFDGDAYLTAFQFSQGRLALRSQFVETVERRQEQNADEMLYHDFGTAAPVWPPRGFKNPPNINVTSFDGMLLALSEASHPTAVDFESLQTKWTYDFKNSLPDNLGFTAHPKIDPVSNDLYAFGITRAISPELKVYRVDHQSKKNTELHSFQLGGFFPIHDCMMTENYMIFVVSPIQVNMLKAATLVYPVADILEYDSSKALRILVFSKFNDEPPLVLESQPSALIFHHINAYEENEKIIFDSILMEDASSYQIFRAWSQEEMPKAPQTWITRFEIDLDGKSISNRQLSGDGRATEFPCIDNRKLGQKLKYFYVLESERGASDPLTFTTLACWDARALESIARVSADAGQSFGEAVFVPAERSSNEEDGWILHMGYDAARDETFLDIRKPVTLERQTRIWLGRHLPLGFHGIFCK